MIATDNARFHGKKNKDNHQRRKPEELAKAPLHIADHETSTIDDMYPTAITQVVAVRSMGGSRSDENEVVFSNHSCEIILLVAQ